MMLVSDMALLWDKDFQWLIFYDRERRQFAVDAVAVWTKLTELGCEALTEPRYS